MMERGMKKVNHTKFEGPYWYWTFIHWAFLDSGLRDCAVIKK